MKVKIGDKVYDSDKEPIMVFFDDVEKRDGHVRNMVNMHPQALHYCVFPDSYTSIEIQAFMKH